MVGDLRLDMERALEDMRTQVFPHLREGTIPSDLEKDGYRGLFMETTLQDQGEVDVMVELEREGFRKIFLDRLSEIVYMRNPNRSSPWENSPPRTSEGTY